MNVVIRLTGAARAEFSVSKGTGSFGAGHRKAAGLRHAHGVGAPSTLLTLLLVLLGAQLGLQQGDPVSNFCRRFGHQAAIIDDRL